ncbi:MAG: choice-of-anchor Q domain-containing protein [Thermofilaceae archaeon]
MCWIGVLALFPPGSWFLQLPSGLVHAGGLTFYVAPTGDDVGDCKSPSSPCRSIQYAVNQAASGDTILVAAGTYTYNPQHDSCSFLPTRAVVCFVDKQLTILGGYSTTNWIRADPIGNPTVIDGGNAYRGVVIVSYHSTASLRMEGFTIRNARAQGASFGGDWDTTAFGGGMWAQNSAVTLRNMVFENNVAKGGDTSSPYGGAAAGGGLAIQSPPSGSVSILEHVTFRNNQAIGGSGRDRGGLALGGGLFTYQAVVSAHFVTFTNNLAVAGSSNGIGIAAGLRADALGGGAAFQQGSSVTLGNVTAVGNQAIGGDAGAYVGTSGGGGFGGAFHSEEATSFVLTDAWIKGNLAQGGKGATGGVGFGGGLELLNSSVTLARVWIVGNMAIGGASVSGGFAGSPGGGGAYLWGSRNPPYSGRLTNVVFADNQIVMSPSGSSVLGGGGGGLVVQGMTVDVIHSTFARNTFSGDVKSGQAILVQLYKVDTNVEIPGVANIRYSIIADHTNPNTNNTSALTVSEGSTANLYKGLFAGNTNNTNLDGRPLPPGTITGLDTMIYASSAGFVAPGGPDYDYHIASNSPAVGQAVDSTTSDDIDGQSRPYGGAADIGADEYMPPMLTVMPPEVTVLVAGDTGTAMRVLVGVKNTTNVVSWEATTTASWLFLGPSGSEKTTSGRSGEALQLWFKPSGLPLSRYDTNVSITSPNAEPVTLPVHMIKVERILTVHLPLILR